MTSYCKIEQRTKWVPAVVKLNTKKHNIFIDQKPKEVKVYENCINNDFNCINLLSL